MGQVLAKSDLAIAARYRDLVPDAATRDPIFELLRTEHERSVVALRSITGERSLVADNPELVRSLAARFPYLDPLNHLQVDLLRRRAAARPPSWWSGASTSRSTAWPPACATAVDHPRSRKTTTTSPVVVRIDTGVTAATPGIGTATGRRRRPSQRRGERSASGAPGGDGRGRVRGLHRGARLRG